MFKQRSRKYILGVITLTLTSYLLLKDWGVIVHEAPKSLSVTIKTKEISREQGASPTGMKKDSITLKRKNTIFKEKDLQEIKQCIPSFSSNNPQDLSDLALPKGENLIFTRLNRHYATPANVVLQHRAEGPPGREESFYYKLENNLPILITELEFSQLSTDAKLIYTDEIKKSENAEIIVVEDKIVKIETEKNGPSLSCDLINQEWDCICIKN